MAERTPGAVEKPGFACACISKNAGFKPKWTNSDVGAVMDAGWSLEGVQRFTALRTQIKAARKTANGKKFEKDFLEKVRTKHKVSGGPKTDKPPPKKFRNSGKTVDLSSLNDSDEE